MAKGSGGGASDGGRGGSGARAKRGAGTSARDTFDFLNERLRAGGLKKGERASLTRRIEQAAKEILSGS